MLARMLARMDVVILSYSTMFFYRMLLPDSCVCRL